MKATFDLQNPWRRPGYAFPKEAVIPRDIFDRVLKDLGAREIIVILGARQVGKTFLIKKLIQELIFGNSLDPRQIFYFNLDAFNLIELVSRDRDFLDFIRAYGLPGKRSLVIFDEALRIPEIGLLMKQYYDLDLDCKFIVSGSSSLQIKSQTKETLTGRKQLYELYPVSFAEFLRFKGLDCDQDLSRIMKFESAGYQTLMEEFVRFGGYPGVVKLETPEEKQRLLQEIFNSYVEKDISSFLNIEDVAGFNRLVQFLSAQSGGLFKINEAAKNVGISRHYVQKYLQALSETYVTACLRPYFVNLGKAIVKTPKLYFCDTGIRNAVFNAFEPMSRSQEAGQLVENFVFSELIKTHDRNRLWFYRTNTGSEIDFLSVHKDRVTALEVKYRKTHQHFVPKVFETVARFSSEVNTGMIITKDYLSEEQRSGMRVVFRPAWSVFGLGRELAGGGSGTQA